ncbi:MAG TPA: hypothetical protein VIH99_02480 [Bdellovibrionota bacterium]|jgi:hypothetical protein
MTYFYIFLALFPFHASAAPLPKLAQLFEQRLQQVEKRMATYQESGDQRWQMARFTIGFFPRVGFKLPGVYSISVAGELDLVFVPHRD